MNVVLTNNNNKEETTMKMMNDYYPDDIARALCYMVSDNPDKETIDDCENALYNIKCIAGNEFNDEFYRTFWNVLQKITEKYENDGRVLYF